MAAPAGSDTVTFGSLLREFRCAAGLSQEALAERARLSPGAVSTLERSARRAPQHQTLALLVEALRLAPDDRARLEAAAVSGRRRGARERSAVGSPAVPNNVPNVPSAFFGREAELTRVAELLHARRLTTILGTGGVGKTRLALQTALARLHDGAFADGVWFVELGPLASGDLVATAIARAMDVREAAGVPLVDSLVAAIGSRAMLLVLDNCEHVVDACARVAELLLRTCGRLTLLTTTREALSIDGEHVVQLAPLAFDAAVDDPPALALLADRLSAADAMRYAALTADDRAHAITICRRLDGIPLALELAAGLARDASLAEIAAGLDERFALLGRGRRTASPRHQTLRATIDWSFALLRPAEQRVFARLGLFASAFAPEAAVAACGDDEPVRDALVGLIGKSLVAVEETAGSGLRYRLLETMRAYALDRLIESGDYDACAQRFARYYCDIAVRADATYGRIPNTAFLAPLEPDLEQFRTALTWTLAKGNDPVLGAELCGGLGWCYRQLALFAEGLSWCELALAHEPVLSRPIVGRLHMAVSFFTFNTGELARALAAAECAAAAYDDDASRSEFSWALTQQAYCLYVLGRIGEAEGLVRTAVDAARAENDAFRLAGALNALALTIPVERSHERLAALEEAIRRYREAGDTDAMIPAANLAEAYYAVGDYAAALARGRDVVAVNRRNADRSNLAAALTNVAAYALALRDTDEAERAVREALELMRGLGKTLNAMCALQHLGGVFVSRGEAARGVRLYGAANRMYEDFGLTREFTEQSLYDRMRAEVGAVMRESDIARFLDEGARTPFEEIFANALA